MRIAALVIVLCWTVPLLAEDADQQEYAEQLKGMQIRAQGTDVVEIAEQGRTESALIPEPLYRYMDEPRNILDGTLWAYGGPGRPAALQKIEIYRDQARKFYCLSSLSDNLLEVHWRGGEQWSSKQAGMEFKSLAEAPRPTESKTVRLIQMKQIASRFRAELFNEGTQQAAEMRRLPRPIHRYADPTQGIEDGTIFGYATYGTNPDVLLSIELHQDATGPSWKYALARMTLYKVTVELDDKQVWQVPYVPWQGADVPSRCDTWLYFYEAAADR